MLPADVLVVISSMTTLAASGYLFFETRGGRRLSGDRRIAWGETTKTFRFASVLGLTSFITLIISSYYESPFYGHVKNLTVIAVMFMNFRRLQATGRSDNTRIVFVLSMLAIGVYVSIRIAWAVPHR